MSLADELLADLEEDDNVNDDLEEVNIKEEPEEEVEMEPVELMEIDVSVRQFIKYSFLKRPTRRKTIRHTIEKSVAH